MDSSCRVVDILHATLYLHLHYLFYHFDWILVYPSPTHMRTWLKQNLFLTSIWGFDHGERFLMKSSLTLLWNHPLYFVNEMPFYRRPFFTVPYLAAVIISRFCTLMFFMCSISLPCFLIYHHYWLELPTWTSNWLLRPMQNLIRTYTSNIVHVVNLFTFVCRWLLPNLPHNRLLLQALLPANHVKSIAQRSVFCSSLGF